MMPAAVIHHSDIPGVRRWLADTAGDEISAPNAAWSKHKDDARHHRYFIRLEVVVAPTERATTFLDNLP